MNLSKIILYAIWNVITCVFSCLNGYLKRNSSVAGSLDTQFAFGAPFSIWLSARADSGIYFVNTSHNNKNRTLFRWYTLLSQIIIYIFLLLTQNTRLLAYCHPLIAKGKSVVFANRRASLYFSYLFHHYHKKQPNS